MHLKLSKLAPGLMATLLVLAGCKTPPAKTPAAAAPSAQSPAAGTTAPPARLPAATSSVEFYVAQAQPSEGAVDIKLSNGSKVYLLGQPVLTRNDLTEAAALTDRQGQNFVGLRFTEAGARKLNELSSKNIGNILALVVNRELVAAPRIVEPLNRGVLTFGVPSAKIAAEIAARIRGDQEAAASPVPARSPKPSKPSKPLNPATRKTPASRP